MRNDDKRKERIAQVKAELASAFLDSLRDGMADPQGWTPPWHSLFAVGQNPVTNHVYRGGNLLRLAYMQQALGFEGPWATYKQWETLDATVQPGQHGVHLLRPHTFYVPAPTDDDPEHKKRITVFKTFVVFAASQVDGWEAPQVEGASESERIANVEAFVKGTGAKIKHHKESSAYFTPGTDTISLPPLKNFHDAEGYYGTLLHELTHWTAGKDRLTRECAEKYATPSERAKEELVAELGAAILGSVLGITTGLREEHRDYLAHWLQVLSDDPDALWKAAGQAQQAADYLHDLADGKAAAAHAAAA